jgi:ATP-dependent protease ClpP protease subunit
MALMPSFELPKNPTRIWDLEVPIVVDDNRNMITAYITGAIEEPSHYNELCYLLNIADDKTTIYLHINTPGGIIDSAFMLVNAIKRSKAKVIGNLSGTVASAGTLISMACDELDVAPHLSFMIHNYSGGMSGKGHEMKARQNFTDKHLNEAFTCFYKGFLTEDEMDNVVNGTDFWMGSEDVKTRWGQRVDYLLSKA